MFFTSEKGIIGLDIGSNSIKAVQLREAPEGFHLERFGIVPLMPEIIVDGAIMDASRVVEAIRTLIKEQKIKTKNAAISVSGHASVIVKRITIPEMTEEELSESIRWEAEQYIPFPIDDVNLDFEILFRGREETGRMEVLLVAAKKDKINDYVAVTTEAGLSPVIVDVDAFAIENMYEINYELERGKTISLVNIGASTMNMNIIKDGFSIFTRDSSIGGNQFTEAIQKEFGLGFEDAERVKKGEEVPGVSPEDVGSIMETLSSDIVLEISRSFDYFKSAMSGEEAERLILSGGCAKVKGLSDILVERLGIPVEVVNPFRNINIDPRVFDTAYLEDIAPMAAVAVGLAIRRVWDR